MVLLLYEVDGSGGVVDEEACIFDSPYFGDLYLLHICSEEFLCERRPAFDKRSFTP